MKDVCPDPGRAVVFMFAIDKAVLSPLKRTLKSFGPSSEVCLIVCGFTKSNIVKPSGISKLCVMFIRLNCCPCHGILTQELFNSVNVPALMTKFDGPSMSRGQGS